MMKKLALPLIAALPLGACISLGAEEPPATLFTLSAAAQPERPAPETAEPNFLTVAVPKVPAALQTLRLPVRVSATEYAYLKDAQWVEQPNRLFQRLVSDTVAAQTSLVPLDPRQTTVDPGRRLIGELLDFGLDVTGDRVVKVRYNATLAGPGSKVAVRQFAGSEPVASDDPKAVAAALNRAANRVAADVAAWVAGN